MDAKGSVPWHTYVTKVCHGMCHMSWGAPSLIRFDGELFDFSVDGPAAEAQDSSGLRFVPGGLPQGMDNGCILTTFTALQKFGGRSFVDVRDVGRQVIDGDDILTAKNEGVLEGMGQLPHISRPGIAHEDP